MAKYVSNGSGQFSTATIWDKVVNTPTLHASTNISVSTSGLFSATFTAPNLVNNSTGVMIFMVTRGTPTSWTATLQEDLLGTSTWVDTAATATITTTNINAVSTTNSTAGQFIYFRWGTPYLYATTGAGRYRIKLQVSSTTGTPAVAADSGASNFAYLTTDDENATPGTSDDVWVMGSNGSTTVTVTVDGTSNSVGTGADFGSATHLTSRSILHAVNVGDCGILQWDTTATTTLTVKGGFFVYGGGHWKMIPPSLSIIHKLSMNQNGTDANSMFGSFTFASITLTGSPNTSTSLYKTTLASGVGTAASPMVTATAVDWAVGDHIIIAPTTDLGTTQEEERYIITKNSSTSYVLSSSAGGAETAFSNSHSTSARIFNLTRNVIVETTSSTHGTAFYPGGGGASVTETGTISVSWARLSNFSRGLGGASNGWTIRVATGCNTSMDYLVAYNGTAGSTSGFTCQNSIPDARTYTGLISVPRPLSTTSGSHGFFILGGNMNFTDCFAFKSGATGFNINLTGQSGSGPVYNCVFTRCVAWGANQTGTQGGGFNLNSQADCQYIDCEAHCNSLCGISVFAYCPNTVFTRFLGGTKGKNSTADIRQTNNFNSRNLAGLVFDNCTFESANLIPSYTLSLAGGSLLAFQNLQTTANNHIWYTSFGTARSTGAGLTDTTIHTSGSLGLRIAPEDLTTGMVWTTLVPARVGQYASIAGFVKLNSAFTGDASASCTVELYLPGSTTADATTTISKSTTDWQVFNIAANYTGSVPLYATVKFIVKTTTASAYAYFDDFFNGTNVITGLDLWYRGQPSAIMFEQLGDAAAVWAVLRSTQTTAGTMGNWVTKLLNVGKFLGLK